MRELQKKDLKYIWHPCSQAKDYETFSPIVIKRGKGVYLYDMEERAYLDGVSSWWVNLFGHSNDRINNAIISQLSRLEHVIFANFTHEKAIEFSEKIIKLAPEGLSRVFFSDNGSSAVEIALKMSYHYHSHDKDSKKRKFISLSNAYHGETLGALSVGDLGIFSDIYKPLMINHYKAEAPDCYRCKYDNNRENCQAECFAHMEELLIKNHKEIASVIIEPMVQGAAGMKIYSSIYLKKLRKICDEYNVHLIADEIAVGFGRTGKMFACEHGEISPDFMILSKGITAGYMGMSAVLTTEEIYNSFYGDYNELRTFMHSHTYAGNALACAAACETLKIFEEESIIEKNINKSAFIKSLVDEKVKNHPYIGEFRQIGMIGAIELVKDRKTKDTFPLRNRVGYSIYKNALRRGVLLRPLGDIIYFMPPYCIEERDIDKMVTVAIDSINEYFNL